MQVTYATIQPILQQHCAPCHTVGGSGGANFAAKYADSQLNSYYCPGLTKVACLIVRIRDCSMPQGANCTGNPVMDVGKASCTDAMDQMLLQQWVADGQQP